MDVRVPPVNRLTACITSLQALAKGRALSVLTQECPHHLQTRLLSDEAAHEEVDHGPWSAKILLRRRRRNVQEGSQPVLCDRITLHRSFDWNATRTHRESSHIQQGELLQEIDHFHHTDLFSVPIFAHLGRC
jgi:uncharacterized protein (DUF2249 family)